MLKDREKAARGATAAAASTLDGIPPALPALARSQKIQTRVARTGFDWPDIDGVFAKLDEEVAEVRAAATADEKRAELGDILFVVVNLARWLGADAETALREANERFSRRFRSVEQLAAGRGLALSALSFAELDALWNEAKAVLARSGVTDTVTGEPG